MRGGLYIHLPFCVTKCPYCDFFSITDRSRRRELAGAIGAEAAREAGKFGAFDTLYLGGGTPSCLELELIEGLVEGLPEVGAGERTVELNPEDVTGELLRGLLDLGFNRISLGVQSFHDDELAFLGRRHRAAKARWAVEAARRAGFAELSLDLMYGLSRGGSAGRWRRSLETALSFDPEHLSCYGLTLAEGTPFHRREARGELTLPDDETAADLFLMTSGLLRGRGYEHYEVSNFALRRADADNFDFDLDSTPRAETQRPGSADEPPSGGWKPHRSRHNGKYWRHVPYLGLGPSAHSFDGRRRWWNVASVDEYIERAGRGERAAAGEEVLTEEQLRLEALYLGFRTSDGVPLDLVRDTGGWEGVVERLVAEGLVRVEGERLIPTVRGFLVADGLPLRFDL